ncbi:MAG: nucleotidyltransferase family protein, partial [Cyclobacteriaceae bacterium]|nr:nucleotidyltransferase family protein [Cyclobacteriaceae bacterium]
MVNVSAIILAAGLSSRMGNENKLFLNYNDKPIIEWVIENIGHSEAHELIVVASELSYERLKAFSSSRVRVVDNPAYKQGMTSSIQSGVQALGEDSEGYMICLGDQPTLKKGVYNQLIHAFSAASHKNKKSIIVPFYKKAKGNPVI